MKIIRDLPPNFDQIAQAFDLRGMKPIFAWGDVLYVPYDQTPDAALMAHEETHSRQQALHGVQKWWDRYLVDADFRLVMEIEAYQNQFECARGMIKDRNQLNRYLRQLAIQLASPMYGSIITISQAQRAIVDKSIGFDVAPPEPMV